MTRKIGKLTFCLLFAVQTVLILNGQEGPEELRRGIDLYKDSNFAVALATFKDVLDNEEERSFHGDAIFWVAKTESALGNYTQAVEDLDHFLESFPENPYFSMGKYERARLLHLQGKHQEALVLLEEFISSYPQSAYVPNAYYWMGEALYALGDLKNAEIMFYTVSLEYPESFRAEAARYRRALLGLKYREEELLKLLNWSHQEHLRSLEEARESERAFAETLENYRQRIRALEEEGYREERIDLQERVHYLEEELQRAQAEIEIQSMTEIRRTQALEVKEEALRLKEYYLDRLIREYEGKQ